MKKLLKLTRLTTALAILPIVASIATHPVAAQNQGQIEGGDMYRIENVTQNLPFTSTQTANACDTLEYKVRLYNPDDVNVDNVTVQASLTSEAVTTLYSNLVASSTDATPSAVYMTATLNLTSSQTVSYVAGSTQLLDQNDNLVKVLPDGFTTPAGINVGTLTPSEVEFVQFEAKVSCPVTPPPTPSYACTILGLTAEENRTVKISNFATTQSNGAAFNNAVINWGDNSAPLTSNSPIDQTHQYSANGTYTVTATAYFNVPGQSQPQSATSASCEQVVTFTPTTPPTVTPPVTPVTPATPTALVNTGPGSVIGLFAAATIGGTVIYRRLLARRLSRQ